MSNPRSNLARLISRLASGMQVQVKQPEPARGWLRLSEAAAYAAPAMLWGGAIGTLLAVFLGNLKSSSLPGIGGLIGAGMALAVFFLKQALSRGNR